MADTAVTTMTVYLHLFAGLRTAALTSGWTEVTDVTNAPAFSLSLAKGSTLEQLRHHLQEKLPDQATLLSHCVFALNNEFIPDQTVILPEACIACIPPVSGGSDLVGRNGGSFGKT